MDTVKGGLHSLTQTAWRKLTNFNPELELPSTSLKSKPGDSRANPYIASLLVRHTTIFTLLTTQKIRHYGMILYSTRNDVPNVIYTSTFLITSYITCNSYLQMCR